MPTGQTLIINALVEMSANAHIYVEKGGVLKVNATITGACGKMWQGIKYGSYLKQANKGRFFNTQFTVNTDFRGGAAKVVFMDIEGTYGIFVSHGLFKAERRACNSRDDRARGIQGYDAGFIITSGTQFESLDFGVHVSTLSLGAGTFSITGNTFTDCFTSIYTSLASGYRISANTFNLNRPDVCDNQQPIVIIGIKSVGLASGVLISGNTFVNTADDITETILGTDCNSLGTTNNLVTGNNFNFADIGNRSSGTNGASSSEGMIFSGLLYECNTHETSFDGDFLVENGQIRRVQGEEIVDPFTGILASTSAGNVFSGINFGFQNNGLALTYYYTNGPGENPGTPPYSTGITPTLADNSNGTCHITEACPNPPCPEVWLANTKAQFLQNKTQWKDKINDFPSIANPGKQIIAGKEISQLRLDLDRDGRHIIQNYQLDTILVKIDSAITWLSNLETYEADHF